MDRQQVSSNTCIAIDRANKESPSKIVDFAIAVAIVATRFYAPRRPAAILRLRGGLDMGMERDTRKHSLMFAVIKSGGKQYKVAKDDIIRVEKLDAEEGANVALDQVLMVGDEKGQTVGAPLVDGAKVSATVLEQMRDRKIIVFKKKRRQNYRRRNGHRQHLTVLRIDDILTGGKKKAAAKKKAAPKKAKEAAPADEAPAAEAEKE